MQTKVEDYYQIPITLKHCEQVNMRYMPAYTYMGMLASRCLTAFGGKLIRWGRSARPTCQGNQSRLITVHLGIISELEHTSHSSRLRRGIIHHDERAIRIA